MKHYLPAFFLILTFPQLFSQSLDNTFSSTGYAIETLTTNEDAAKAMAIQSDGKILLAGFQNNGANEDIVVLRYNTNGTLDNTFSSDGIVTIALSSSSERANAIALQSDGRIVIVGSTNTSGTNDFLVCRLTDDGLLDNTFDTDGIVTTDNIRLSTGSSSETASAVAIQSDGSIVVVGTGYSGNLSEGFYDEFAVVRYTSNGSLDNTFSDDGKFTTGGNDTDAGNAVAIQSDGKILVGGTSLDGNTYIYQVAVLRLNSDGTLDTDFDTDGKFFANQASTNTGLGLIAHSNTKISILGNSNGGYTIQRINTDGSIDNAFGTGGITSAAFGTPTSFTMQADGKYLVAGQTSGTNNEIVIARFNEDGTIDNTFDTDGKLNLGFAFVHGANAIALDSDNKIVLSGYAQNLNPPNGTDFLVVRCTSIINSVLEKGLTNITFHPNPTTHLVNIDLENDGNMVHVETFNSLGSLISNHTFFPAQPIQIELDQSQGVYFMNITRDGVSKKVKIIKQ